MPHVSQQVIPPGSTCAVATVRPEDQQGWIPVGGGVEGGESMASEVWQRTLVGHPSSGQALSQLVS